MFDVIQDLKVRFTCMVGGKGGLRTIFCKYTAREFEAINFILSNVGETREISFSMGCLANYLKEMIILQEKSVASTVTSLCGVCATYSFMYCEEEKFLYDVGRMQIFKPEPQFDYENGICVIYLTENFFNYIVAKKYVEKLKSEMKSSVINKEVISENSAKNTREGWKSTLLRRIKGRKLF